MNLIDVIQRIALDIRLLSKKVDSVDSKPNRPPSSFSLDRTTNPWTIWFDNGSSLQFPTYGTTATIYGYGYPVNEYSKTVQTWPLIGNVMSLAHGALTLEALKTTQRKADYWADDTLVINPVRDASVFDFKNARFTNTGSTDYEEVRQKNAIRVYYELGLLSEEEILNLGAVKK